MPLFPSNLLFIHLSFVYHAVQYEFCTLKENCIKYSPVFALHFLIKIFDTIKTDIILIKDKIKQAMGMSLACIYLVVPFSMQSTL